MKKLRIILEMIKFEHTIFALPFAYLGAFIGAYVLFEKQGGLSPWPSGMSLIWITLAMIGARSAAMALNRLIDRAIDARNPRTSSRALPAGKLSVFEVLLFIAGSFALLFFSAYMLNPLAVKLLPIAVFFLVFYSYTKRFTWFCHFLLGIAIGIAPLGGWVGATGTLYWEAFILFIAVALWTAGFDIIYATQDTSFDKEEKLFSIPSFFGVYIALIIARISHILTVLFLIFFYLLTPLNWLFLVGILLVAVILMYEHRLVKADDLSKVNLAFFTMNGIISVLIFIFTMIDLIFLGE